MKTQTSQADDVRWLLMKAEELILTARKITPSDNPLQDDLDSVHREITKAQITHDNQRLDLGARH